MSTRIICLFLSLLSLPALAARFYYTGVLGGRQVQMDLTFDTRGVEQEPEIKKGEVYGHFQYDDGELHPLFGTLRHGRLVLKEDPIYSKHTQRLSTFTGRLTADRKTFTGVRTAAGDTHPLPFALSAVAEYRAVRQPRRWQMDLSGVYPVFYHDSPGLRALQQRCRERLNTALFEFARENRDGHSETQGNRLM